MTKTKTTTKPKPRAQRAKPEPLTGYPAVVKFLTKKKLLKKKHSHRAARGFFIIVAAVCTGSLAFALSAAKPAPTTVKGQTSLRPAVKVEAPVVAAVVSSPAPAQIGLGSWYALGLPAPDSLTCASRQFGRGTYLSVKNLRNGRVVVCHVNDYGPEVWTGRVIDLSRGSFREVESLGAGTIPVEIRLASGPQGSLNLPNVVGDLMGYNLCRSKETAQFCETNRQHTDLLR